MPKEQSFFARIPRCLCVLTGLMLVVILCLTTLFQGAFRQYYGGDSLLSNRVSLLISLTFLGLLLGASVLFQRALPLGTNAFPRPRALWRLCALFGVLFLLQCLIARSIWFYFGFDPSNVCAYSAALVTGDPIDREYFQLCPNNAPITLLMALPYWVGYRLGLAEPYVMEVYFSVLFLNLGCFFAVLCLAKLCQHRAAWTLGLVLCILWILLSPYMVMPYTDTIAILFPILAFFVMLRPWKTPMRYGLSALLCSIGGAVKPTVFIMLIAIILLGIFRLCASKEPLFIKARRGLWTLIVLLVGLLPGLLFQNAAIVTLAGEPLPEKQLGTAHYLMIGMDDQYWGGHSVEDLAFSQSFDTLAERNAANLKKAWDFLHGRTLTENLHFFAVKAFKAYADGTFAWNGSALMDSVPKRSDPLSLFFRSIYYARGDWNQTYCTLMQCLWLLVLPLCAFASLVRRREYPVQLAALALLGLTGYQLLFEVWPRYLFLYAPMFATLSTLGLDWLLGFSIRTPSPRWLKRAFPQKEKTA